MLHLTKPSIWFITWPGTSGKDNPSGMSRLITGTPLCLEDISVCTHTCALEFHVYYYVLGLLFLCQGGYTFITPTLTSSLVKPFPVQMTLSAPLSPSLTIIPPKWVNSSPFRLTPLIRKWCQGIQILQGSLVTFGNIGKRRRRRRRSLICLSSEDSIRKEASILKARESRSG